MPLNVTFKGILRRIRRAAQGQKFMLPGIGTYYLRGANLRSKKLGELKLAEAVKSRPGYFARSLGLDHKDFRALLTQVAH